MDITQEYKELDRLNRLPNLSDRDLNNYDRLISIVRTRPVSDIFRGTAYESMPIQELYPNFTPGVLQNLAQAGVSTVISLLDLDRLTEIRGVGPGRWTDMIMPAKDSILSRLPEGYLDSWLKGEEVDPIPDPESVPAPGDEVCIPITPEVEQRLAAIPVSDVQDQISKFDGRLYNPLVRNHVNTLADVFHMGPMSEIEGGGKKFMKLLEKFEEDLRDNVDQWENYARQYRESQELHIFPSEETNTDNETNTDTLCERLQSAIEQLYSYIDSNPNISLVKAEIEYLKCRFVEKRSREEMVNFYFERNGNRRSAESLELLNRKKVISKLLAGEANPIAHNVCLSQQLLDELDQMRENLLWKPVKTLLTEYKIPIDSLQLPIFKEMLQLSEYSIGNGGDHNNMVFGPDSSTGIIGQVTIVVQNVIKKHPIPETEETIINECLSDVNKIMQDEEASEKLISSILKTHPDIEEVSSSDDLHFQQKYSCLKNVEKAVRILYEAGRELSMDEIKETDRQRDPNGRSLDRMQASRVTEKYPALVSSTRNNYLRFKTGNIQTFTRTEVLELVTQYGKKHGSFTQEEIAKEIESKGASLNPNTLRTYILKICSPHVTEKNRFKLKAMITEQEADQWSKPRIYGVHNQVLRSAVEILSGKDEMQSDLETLVKELDEKFSGYEANLKYRFRTYLFQYSQPEDSKDAPDSLFITFTKGQKEMIRYNKAAVDDGLYDLEKIGFISRKPAYYMELLTKAVTTLKAQPDHQILLNEFRDQCKDIIPADYSWTPFYKLFSKDGLREHSAEIERMVEGGSDWLILKTDKLESANYQAVAVNDAQVDVQEAQPLVQVQDKRQAPVASFAVNWDTLLANMQTELAFYGKVMWDSSIRSFDEGIHMLLDLIRKSDNRNLREILTRDLYELWNYKIDKYDLFNYLQHLSTFYEALICEIYRSKNGSLPDVRTQGVVDMMNTMDDTKAWVELTFQKGQTLRGFDKILKDLRYKRNIIAHGMDVELSSFQMSQTINQFIALYVYTVARFMAA